MLRAARRDGLIVAHVALLSDALQELLDHGADCVIVHLAHDEELAIEVTDQIATTAPSAAVLILTDAPETDPRGGAGRDLARQAIRHGAQDWLRLEDLSPRRLLDAVLTAIERKRAAARLVRQALHDPLTGLPNRTLFLDRLGVALDRAKRTGVSLAVVFLDVDGFKQVNDTFGHTAGDVLLSTLGERLRKMLRPMDTVARFGGDEFIFLFEELASEREVVLIAERISRALSAPVALDDGEVTITVSLGITLIEEPKMTPDEVIREADAAMYQAKRHGRARYELFDDHSRARADGRLELEAELRRAVERAELRVFYQPRVSLDPDAGLVGFEALLRWEHPIRGLIPPVEFLPLAEEIGMIGTICDFVIADALEQIREWRRRLPGVTVSVNISSRQLEDGGLVPRLSAALANESVDPDALCVELTEHALARDPELAAQTIQRLKDIGVQVYIDDYGTGPSLLASLGELPVDAIKIHESFIRRLDGDPRDDTVVGAVIELGHALGLNVVAEGVETPGQLARLRALGCDDAQGYLFSPAVPHEQAEALLTAR